MEYIYLQLTKTSLLHREVQKMFLYEHEDKQIVVKMLRYTAICVW